MKILIAVVASVLFFQISSAKGKEAEHRHAHKHQHGSAELAIAFDNAQGKIEFKSPADSIVGFEHSAKSAKDKATLADAVSLMEKNISKLLQFDSKLNCQFKKDKIDMIQEKGESHSDFVAHFSVTCNASPVGTSLVFDFTGYPKLKDIDASLIVDSFQKSVELKSEKMTVELK